MFKKILILIFLVSCSQLNTTYKDYLNKNEIIISKEQLERFKDYFSNNYYSYQFKKRISATPVVFALSNDGSKSLIIMCEHLLNASNCNASVEIIQAIRYYEKKIKDKLRIIAVDNKVFIKDKKITVFNNKELTNIFKNNFKLNNNKNNIFFDRLLLDRSDSCTPDC